MKRIGLMTCYINNFGACLQAYALQTAIKKSGYICEIIRYTPVRSMKSYSFPIKTALRIRNILKGIKSKPFSYENARHKCFSRFRKQFLIFGKKAYNEISELYKQVPDYDCFVTGSDQLWNPLIHGGVNNKAYFLDFVPSDKKRIAYAPSIGIDKLPESCIDDFVSLIKKFDALSVRESAGQRIIESLSGRECRVVLDPTLLLTKDEWLSLSAEPVSSEPYIFCYIFSERDYVGSFIEHVRNLLGFKVVTIPFTAREFNSDSIKMKSAGPQDFISLIANASLVITDSFHATAFSINLNRPFYSLMRNSENEKNNMNSRIDSILAMTGLEKRKITCKEDFPEIVDLDIDFSNANKIISEKRSADMNFLLDSIEG